MLLSGCGDPHSERARYRIHSGCGRNRSFGESSAYPRWSETVKQCFCPGAVIHTRSVLGIVNFSGTLRWVDITVLIKIFQSPDDIARPRGRVFDADHPLTYIGRGVFVGIGWSASYIYTGMRRRVPQGRGWVNNARTPSRMVSTGGPRISEWGKFGRRLIRRFTVMVLPPLRLPTESISMPSR